MATNDPSTPESLSETTSRSAAWRTPLLWAAGVDTDGQGVTTRADRARYGSQGALLILLGFIAAASVLLAGSQIGLPLAATIAAAIVWGSMVFFLSRTATLAPTDVEPSSRRLKQIVRIAPLAVLLTLVSVFVSQVLLLTVLADRIDVRLAEEHASQITEVATTVRQEGPFVARADAIARDVQGAASTADQAAAAEDEARRAFEAEVTGTSGTGVPGEGPDTQRERESYEQAMALRQQAAADLAVAKERATAAQAVLDADISAEIAARSDVIRGDDGLLARTEALDEVAADSTGLNVMRWWLTITVILVFLTPLFLALSTPRPTRAAPMPATP